MYLFSLDVILLEILMKIISYLWKEVDLIMPKKPKFHQLMMYSAYLTIKMTLLFLNNEDSRLLKKQNLIGPLKGVYYKNIQSSSSSILSALIAAALDISFSPFNRLPKFITKIHSSNIRMRSDMAF